jgi:hypothetical protein
MVGVGEPSTAGAPGASASEAESAGPNGFGGIDDG